MPVFLHVGCGPTDKTMTTRALNAPDWREVRLDIDPAVKPDIVGSTTDMSAVADGSMDAVFSSHNIEHLYPAEVPLALGEFMRVLTPQGFAVVTCPDLQSVAALVAEGQLTEPAYVSPVGPISPLDILYGHGVELAQGNLHMAHRTGFTNRTLEEALRAAGFASVAVLRRPSYFDLWAIGTASRTEPQALRALVQAHFPISGATAAP
jgi:hypothetical protein